MGTGVFEFVRKHLRIGRLAAGRDINIHIDSPSTVAEPSPTPEPTPTTNPPSSAQSSPTDGEKPLVYLELTTNGTQLQRRYRVYPGDGAPIRLPTDKDCSDLRDRLQRWSKDGGSALQTPEFGDDLYQALFGPQDKRSAWDIAANAWQRPPDHPRHRPLQLRIITDDRLLAGLPWHQTRCDGALLIKDGWSFAVGHAIDQRPVDLVCSLPGRVLTFIPAGVAPEQAALQHSKIDACLQNLWPDKPGHHTLPSEPISQWPPAEAPSAPPCLIYVETRGRLRRHRLELQNGDGEWFAPGELLRSAARPMVAFLNLEFDTGTSEPAKLTLSAEDCPLLIVQRHTTSGRGDAGIRAQSWLRSMMTGEHPVEAAHRHLLDTTTVLAGFHHWRPQYHDGAPLLSDRERARLRLDRHLQRREIKDEVDQMVDRADRRLIAAFAYGVDGNRPELFAGQMRESLLAPRLKLQIQSRIVHQPDCDPVDGGTLLTAFCDALQADSEEPLPRILNAKRPPPRPGYKTLLLFHWRRGDGATGWNPAAREAWERFCRETLADACPPELNILALLPLAIDSKELGALRRQVTALRQLDHQRTNYRLLRLPPLSTVDIEEVRDFLVDEMDPSYPRELLEDLPGLILCAANGDKPAEQAPFEPTARVLQQGFDQGWDILREDLRQRCPPPE